MIGDGGELRSVWAGLAPQITNSDYRVGIVEALVRTEAPLSVADLYFIFDEAVSASCLGYHLGVLADGGAIEVVWSEEGSGRTQRWFYLRGRLWNLRAASFQLAA